MGGLGVTPGDSWSWCLVWDDESKAVWHQLGLKPGWRCSAGLLWELLSPSQRGMGSALAPCSISGCGSCVSPGPWEHLQVLPLCVLEALRSLGGRILGGLWQQWGRRRLWSHF